MNTQQLDRRRITIFLGFTFGISWITGVVIALTGGLVNSPVLVPGTTLTLATVLLASGYMWGPALGNILTRIVTREGWRGSLLAPQFRQGWLYWLLAWTLPGLLSILGAALFFLLSPAYFDPEMTLFSEQIRALTGQEFAVPTAAFALIQVVQAVLIAPVINALPTFGEEFGWRGYLQPKLMPLGGRRAVLLTGLIWGVWHWPAIVMGHNYGFNYPGAPWLGPLAMVWFTLSVGVVFGWLTIKGRSVWPAVIAHGALNGIAAIGTMYLAQTPNLLLGPVPTGILAGLPFTILAVILLLVPGALEAPAEPEAAPMVDGSVGVPDLTNAGD